MRRPALFITIAALVVLTGVFPSSAAEVATPASGPALAEAPLHQDVATAAGHATPAPGGHGEAGLFSFDAMIVVSQMLNFLILLALLRAFFFGPIGQILEQRAQKVKGELEEAARKNTQAQSLQEEYRAKLAAIDQECYRLRQEAITEAQKAKETILAEAGEKAEALQEQARREIAMERDRAWASLKERMVQLTMLAAEKVIETSLDDQMHHDLIRKTIDRLDQAGQPEQPS
ncbi:MAG: F0F1 ATP synthase subunit B [Candidatus Riflebacteria bacterium]|nr:F0F1 ATP synthase subunit B [Candidatus Riflebacteria bacterium]